MIAETVNIFANPIAGRGHGRWTAQRLEKRLRADGYDVRTCFDRPEDLALWQVDGPIRAALIIGGDGTLRAVAARLLELRGQAPPLLPVPLGTANLMGVHLGIDWNVDTVEAGVSDAVRQLRIRTLDAGLASGKLFFLMAGIGFDAQVVHEMDRVRKGPINKASYLLPAFSTLWDYDFPPLRVIADGKEVWPSSSAVAFVGNVREYGAGFPMLPFARPDDGLLDLCVMPCKSKLDLIRLFLEAAVEKHIQEPSTLYLRAKTLRIESERQTPVQLDGDPAGFTPLDLSLLPARMPFIVPPPNVERTHRRK